MPCAIPSPPTCWAPAAISGPSRNFWGTPRCRRRSATPTSMPPVWPPSIARPIRGRKGDFRPARQNPSGVGFWQGCRGDLQDLVAGVLELDRLMLGFLEAGIADANLQLGGRVLGPHHMLAEYFRFCHGSP